MLPARWFSTVIVALAAVLAAGAGARAQGAGSPYTVNDVDVDVSAPDAIQARKVGMAEARRRAAQMLVERLVAPDERARITVPDDARLESMVRGIEFVRERTAPNRYIATLNVVFAPDAVKGWLGSAGAAAGAPAARPSETVQQRPALVIPLWKDRTGVQPLNDANAWHDAWQALDTKGSVVPVAVIRGDQLDQSVISPEEAYVGNLSALSKINERYHAPIVVVAIVEGEKGGPLTVSGLRYDAQTGARSEIPSMQVTSPGQLGDAVKQMHARLDEQWRGVAVVRRDSQDTLDVFVPLRGLGDWVQVRQRLGSVPAVKNVSVRSLEADRAELRLDYFGTPDELKQTLAQAGLILDKDADKWRLQTR
ncbi:MAG: DUF2066 domain-containing protein [Alphaproteobacteria bacterium]|nr:DUF2066 domain-containing protein [Alphaproteobacteria bacterium]